MVLFLALNHFDLRGKDRKPTVSDMLRLSLKPGNPISMRNLYLVLFPAVTLFLNTLGWPSISLMKQKKENNDYKIWD
jgi:hypothetical protein